MPSPTTYETEHEVTISAPPEAVFGLIADISSWPRVFPPSVHLEYIERGERSERIRVWATANGAVKSWVSRRDLDRERLSIRFRQEVSQPPVAGMGGEWVLRPLPGGRTRTRLRHDFQALGDTEKNVSWIRRAIDRNSGQELAALKSTAERRHTDPELELTFTDRVRTNGAARDVYDFIYEAGRWQDRLPHVSRVVLAEDSPNVQLLEMDTRTADGSVHTTKSARICFPYSRIVYKQTELPALMSLHTGEWLIRENSTGCEISSAHTVVIKPEAIEPVLGEGASAADARSFLRQALGGNSTATLHLAKSYAEQAAAPATGPSRH